MEIPKFVVPKEIDFPYSYFSTVPINNKGFILFRKVQGAMRLLPDFPETCKAILDAVIDEMDGENCSFMLRDRVTGELFTQVARGKNEGESVYYSNHSGDARRLDRGRVLQGGF